MSPTQPSRDLRLTPEQARDLVDLDGRIKEVEEWIERAARAGLPMDAHREQLGQAKALRAGLLREFGPKQNNRL